MPTEQTAPSFGVSSPVVVFLLLTSTCSIMSLWTSGSRPNYDNFDVESAGNHKNLTRISEYISDIIVLCVMLIGIIAMVVFTFKKGSLTTNDPECQWNSRHNLHLKFSLWSITAFFIGTCMLDVNYLFVAVSILQSVAYCDDNEMEVFTANLVKVIFNIVIIAFSVCETVVCFMMKNSNFKPSQWVWHGLAVVQAANVAIWFDSMLIESNHRSHENAGSLDPYFVFCNTTFENRTDHWSPRSSIAAKWFLISSPFLFPISIEFSLLVSELLLDKSRPVGTEVQHFNEDAEEGASSNNENTGHPNELTPLMSNRSENFARENVAIPSNAGSSKIFLMIAVIINIFYLVLTILVFVGYKSNDSEVKVQLRTYDNVFTIYSVIYDLSLIICCAVGIYCCRRFKRQHSHTSFLEYLLLFATSGVFYESIRRTVAFAVNSATSDWISFYYMVEFLDIVQAVLQIVFYFYAKDVKLQLTNDGGRADSRFIVAVFKNITVVIFISNFATWISDSFLLPEMNSSITPSGYSIEQWPVFDNVITPITIFFRFNSALLYWCIGTDVSPPGALHVE